MILVTGAAGFIGFHLVKKLSDCGHKVVAIDNINDFYDVSLKKNRLKTLGIDINKKPFVNKISDNLFFHKIDLLESNLIDEIFEIYEINLVFHLASHAGVKQSTTLPKIYFNNNVTGFLNLIDNARSYGVEKFIYASSSSIYPNNNELNKLNEELCLNNFKSIYAASKMSNEIIANTYAKIYNIQTIGLRFFSVYGAFGRPDMSYFKFINSIFNDKSVNLSNYGNNKRDFTYIDDVINAIWQVFNNEGKNKFSVYNIGAEKPISIKNLIDVIEKILNKKLKIKHTRRFTEDAQNTKSNSRLIKSDYNISFKTNISIGIKNFIKWYRKYKIEYDKFCTNTN